LLAAAAVAALAAACSDRPLPADAASGGTGNFGLGGAGGGTFTPTRKVDMLFVIDDSPETTLMQENLVRNFPVLMNTLQNSPQGLPDLRIAVVSTDMGAGDGSIASCDASGGKNGIFQYTARGDCTSTGLAPGATFIANNGVVQNYTGPLADVFACIARLGEQGCSFEHQLAAATRALGADGRAPPEENQGFLRPEAYLFIIVVTNEDDCSAPPGSALFGSTSSGLDSPLGPPVSFRCNEFGHLCNGVKPPRQAPNGDVTSAVTLEGCVSAEDAGMLIPVSKVVEQLRSLKRFPDQQIAVATVAGPPTPYTVKWHAPTSRDTGPWPEMAQSCTASDASWADPAVRLTQWAAAFGNNGASVSVCNTDYAPSFQRFGDILKQ